MKGYKVYVDQDTCIACGLCCSMCEYVFRINEQGKAEACREVGEDERESVQSAVEACPVGAIRWSDGIS